MLELTQTCGQVQGTRIKTSIFALDHIRQLVHAKALIIVFRSNVVDKVFADGVPIARYALVLDIRLVEQLHRSADIRAEDIHGVPSLAKGWICRGIRSVDLVANGGLSLRAGVEPHLQIVRVVQFLDLQHPHGIALASVNLVDVVTRTIFLENKHFRLLYNLIRIADSYTYMPKEGEGQTAIALLPDSFRATLLDLIANGLGDSLGIYAEAHSIEQIFPYRGVDKHGVGIVEDRLEIGIQMDQK